MGIALPCRYRAVDHTFPHADGRRCTEIGGQQGRYVERLERPYIEEAKKPTPNRMEYVSRVDEILRRVRGRRVLHLGCVGLANASDEERVEKVQNQLHWQVSQVADVFGIDYSEGVVKAYRELGLFDNILVGNVEYLEDVPLDGVFDVVIAGDIIEHVSNPGRMLDGIKRFCHAQTKVLITTPHAFGLPAFIRFVLGRFRDGNEHVMTFNAQNLSTLVRRHGYHVEEVHTCYESYAETKGIVFRLGRAFFRRFPKFGGTLFMVVSPA